jgi:pimeloyl-ACP methyl ester carboxylesterase
MNNPVDFAFLHGGGQGGWIWEETLAALHAQTGGGFGRALVLDVPGCGAKRGRRTDDLTLEDVARELVADIETAGMREVVLVGHSQAGQAMSLMLRLRPALFRRLIYVSCSIPLPGQTVTQMMGTGRQGTHANEVGWPFDPATEKLSTHYPSVFCNDMDRAQARALMARLGRDAWPGQTYSFTDWRYDALGAVPATFVLCLRDNILPMAWQETFADRFKAERRVRIDAGHQVMVSRPHALAEVLRLEARLDERGLKDSSAAE